MSGGKGFLATALLAFFVGAFVAADFFATTAFDAAFPCTKLFGDTLADFFAAFRLELAGITFPLQTEHTHRQTQSKAEDPESCHEHAPKIRLPGTPFCRADLCGVWAVP
jgi:hypothetical protein